MAQSHRPDRVGDQIRETLSEMLTRGAVHDPGIGFITITRIKVSADLQVARVFYTSMGDEKARRETARALGITPNAVKIRLHRARLALRTLLDPHLRREPR